MTRLLKLLLLALHIVFSNTKMLRNDALISKMVSDFQKDNGSPPEERERQNEVPQPNNVMSLMHNVLCKNFPSVPCTMITEDETLRKLIDKSIQQIKYKKMTMDKTTPTPERHLTLFPIINSEDLSNFLQVSDTGYYKYKQKKEGRKKHQHKQKNIKSSEISKKRSKNKMENQKTSVYGRKKIRKFYPHKIKYKDKRSKLPRKDFGDYSDGKLSMSVEIPDGNMERGHLTYRVEPAEPPVWRIDYMKHGDPSVNVFGYDADMLKAKLTKTGPNGMLEDSIVEPRKDVLHPDVYIKKNFVRKNSVDSSGLD